MADRTKKADYDIKYAKQNLKRIPLDVKKEKYEEIKATAERVGETINGYIKKAIDERMIRDNAIGDETSGETTDEATAETTDEATAEATADDETTDELPFDPGDADYSRESYTSATMEVCRQKEQELRELCRELAEHEERMKDLPFN